MILLFAVLGLLIIASVILIKISHTQAVRRKELRNRLNNIMRRNKSE